MLYKVVLCSVGEDELAGVGEPMAEGWPPMVPPVLDMSVKSAAFDPES